MTTLGVLDWDVTSRNSAGTVSGFAASNVKCSYADLSSAGRFRDARATVYPASANVSAVARPMFVPAPMIRTVGMV
jgi:hypothetical protein